MTVTSGFFNSVDGDRTYDAEAFGMVFGTIIEDGVIKNYGTNFGVTAGGGLSLNIGRGRAWFNETWLFNDAVEPIAASASHSGLARIDAVVLEIDRSTAVRSATIKYKQGVASSTPTAPAMTHTSTLNEYAIATVSRAAGSTVITQAHITNLVGTPNCPFAVSKLLDRSFEPSVMHRNIFRGKNLGTSYTAAQKTAIRTGSFEDLYIGDYWVINSTNWRIVDINYFLNTGNTITNIPHIVVMPDSNLSNGVMNDSFIKGNAGGYFGADARSLIFPSMRNGIIASFGSVNDLLAHDEVLTNAIQNGKPSNAAWYNVSMEIPNTAMMVGYDGFNPRADGNNLPPSGQTESTRQFKLFDLAPWFIRTAQSANPAMNRSSWLRDLISPAVWPIISSNGELTYATTTSPGVGFRPYCVLHGGLY